MGNEGQIFQALIKQMKSKNIMAKLFRLGIIYSVFFLISITCADVVNMDKQDNVKILTLMYRGIVKKADGKNVTIASFKKQMEILKKNGYRSIKLKDLLDFYYHGKSLPSNPVLITFDGGRKDSYVYSDKVLKKMGYNAVMFIIPEKVNSNDHFFICWHDVKNMLKTKRWEFGLTSEKGYQFIPINPQNKTGPYLLHRAWLNLENRFESDEEFSYRIKKEYVDIYTKIKIKIEGLELYAISIPYGNYFYWKKEDNFCMKFNRRMAEENFRLVFLQGTSGIIANNDNPLSLGRLIVDGNWTESDFPYYIGLEIPHITSFIDDFNTEELKWQWGIITGNVYNQKGNLYMYPYTKRNDAFLYIKGSEGIENAIIETQAEAIPGSQFWIYTKYFNMDNYVRFGLSKKNFYLQRLENGDLKEQIKGKDVVEVDTKFNTYKLIFKKDAVIAILNGSYFGRISNIDKKEKGIIAIEAWDKNIAGANLSYFRLQRFINQWACLTPQNEADINSYMNVFVVSSTFLPLCYECKDGKVYPTSDFNLMRMISGQYGLLFIPRVYIPSLSNEELKDLKLLILSLFKKYSIAGINIELSDVVSQDIQSVNMLIDNLKSIFEVKDKKFILTLNIPQQLEDYYIKEVIYRCNYIIIKNKELSIKLDNAIKENKRLVKSMNYNEVNIDEDTLPTQTTVAVWEK